MPSAVSVAEVLWDDAHSEGVLLHRDPLRLHALIFLAHGWYSTTLRTPALVEEGFVAEIRSPVPVGFTIPNGTRDENPFVDCPTLTIAQDQFVSAIWQKYSARPTPELHREIEQSAPFQVPDDDGRIRQDLIQSHFQRLLEELERERAFHKALNDVATA